MSISLIEGNSLLAVDIGSVNTRAAYFDVVDGRYRFIAVGQAKTTLPAPTRNVVIGVQQAIQNLQTLVGKTLIDKDGRLIIPSQPDGNGVDSMAATISAGGVIRIAAVGLLADVSLKSAENLAQTTYSRLVDSLDMNDHRNITEQVDALVRLSPELVIIAGGTDGGATQTLHKLLEVVGLASYLSPENKRPFILFAGNSQMADDVRESLGNISAGISVCPNIRPALEVEDLTPAQRELASQVIKIRQKQMPELGDLQTLAASPVLPSAYSQSRMVRFLARYFESGKGVLGVDVGASALSLSVSFDGDLHVSIFPQFGLGEPMARLLRHTTIYEICRWIPLDIPVDTVRDYLYQKSLYPSSIPATPEDLAIEQAIVRHNLHLAARAMIGRVPKAFLPPGDQLPQFEPIIASGAALTGAPTPWQKVLMLLDGLQPVGVTTVVLDQNNMLAMLGAAAEQNSLLPIHVLDSGALAYLAKVISPVSGATFGSPILKVKLIFADGGITESEIKMGALQMLPVPSGQMARLQLRPIGRTDVGMGPGKGVEVEVVGSPLGVVIDARGRPIRLPEEDSRRRDLLQKWHSRLGG